MKSSAAYLTVALPPSVAEDHPDYTRERYTLDQAAGYLQMCRDIVYRESLAQHIGHRITPQSRGTGAKARRLYSQRDLDRYRAATRCEPKPLPRSHNRPSPRHHDITVSAPKVRRFM